jgi:hypothetical protein
VGTTSYSASFDFAKNASAQDANISKRCDMKVDEFSTTIEALQQENANKPGE